MAAEGLPLTVAAGLASDPWLPKSYRALIKDPDTLVVDVSMSAELFETSSAAGPRPGPG